MKLKLNYSIRKTRLEDLYCLNDIYFDLTGTVRSYKEAKWEWFEAPFKKNTSWVILYRNKIVGHHGYIKIPLSIGKKKVIAARTENSMLKKEFRKKIPYFSIENRILNKNKNFFKLFITTAGVNAQLQIRQRLGYKNLGSWKIERSFNPLSYYYNKILSKIKREKVFSENLNTIVANKKIGNLMIKSDVSLGEFSKACKKNLNKEYIEAYPSKNYLRWRFLECPYHTYFKAIIENLETDEIVGIIWYEVLKGHEQYDIIIEYLSINNKCKIKNTLKKLRFVFNTFKKCRLIFRHKEKNNLGIKNSQKSSKVLVFFCDPDLTKKQYYFDSFSRQGITA